MILLLCHLIGDYVLQSHVMATRKTSSWLWAFIHATFYALPFAGLLAWLGPSPGRAAATLGVVWFTHALIDRLRVAASWCAWYGVGQPGIWFRLVRALWESWAQGEYSEPDRWAAPVFEAPPPFIGVWLVIIVDNTLHLAFNAIAFWGLL